MFTIVWVLESKTSPGSSHAGLKFFDGVCFQIIYQVTKGFSCCIISFKSIQHFDLVDKVYTCMMCTAVCSCMLT